MRIEDALDQLGRQIGLALKLDSQRCCRLVFDRRTPIDIELVEDGTVFLHTAIGRLPPNGDAALLTELLEANLFGRGTGRAVLGVDGNLREIVLHRALDMNRIEYADFTAALEDFLTRARAWSDRLSSRAQSTVVAESQPLGSFVRA